MPKESKKTALLTLLGSRILYWVLLDKPRAKKSIPIQNMHLSTMVKTMTQREKLALRYFVLFGYFYQHKLKTLSLSKWQTKERVLQAKY